MSYSESRTSALVSFWISNRPHLALPRRTAIVGAICILLQLVAGVHAQPPEKVGPDSIGRPLNQVERVAVDLQRQMELGTLHQLTQDAWRAHLLKLDQYARHRKVNGDRLDPKLYYGLRARIEVAVGNEVAAVRFAKLYAAEDKKTRESDVLLNLAEWCLNLGDSGGAMSIRMLAKAIASGATESPTETVRIARASMAILQSLKQTELKDDVARLLELRVAELDTNLQAELFFDVPNLFGDSQERSLKGTRLLKDPSLSRIGELFTAARLLLDNEDKNAEAVILSNLSEAEQLRLEVVRLSGEARVRAQRALATYQLFAGRSRFLDRSFPEAIKLLSSAADLFSEAVSASVDRKRTLAENPEAWSVKLAEMRTRQHLSTTLNMAGDENAAEIQYALLDAGIEDLRTGLDEQKTSDPAMKDALDLLEYEYRVNRAQNLLSRGRTDAAEQMIRTQLYNGEIQLQAAAMGLNLQYAKNELSLARLLLRELLQKQGEADPVSVRESRDYFVSAYRRADQQIGTAELNSRSADPRQVEMAREIRGIAGYYLSGLPAESGDDVFNPSDSLTKAETDLRAAAEYFLTDSVYADRAAAPLTYLAHIYIELLGRSDEDALRSRYRELGVAAINRALELSRGNAVRSYNALMIRAALERRSATSAADFLRVEKTLAAAREFATRGVIEGRDREIDPYELKSMSEAFDLGVDMLLGTSDPIDSDGVNVGAAQIDRALQIIDRASELAHAIDRPYLSRSFVDVSSFSNLEDFKKQEEAGKLVIIFHFTDTAGYLIVPSQSRVLRLDIRRAEMESLVDRVIAEVSVRPSNRSQESALQANRSISATNELATLLFPGFVRTLISDPKQDVLIVRTGALAALPLEVLFYNEREIPRFSYATSAVPVSPAQQNRQIPICAIAVGVGNNATSGLPQLAFAEKEAENIAGFFQSSIILTASKGNADRSHVLNAISTQDKPFILHFAAHSVLDSGQLLAKESNQVPALVLQDVESEPDVLPTSDLARLDLSACELTIISSCDSAISSSITRFNTGDSLANACFDAGARRVLASCWKVDDAAGNEFTSTFSKLAFGDNRLDYSAAVQKAREELRKTAEYSHPYYWAPFVLLESDLRPRWTKQRNFRAGN